MAPERRHQERRALDQIVDLRLAEALLAAAIDAEPQHAGFTALQKREALGQADREIAFAAIGRAFDIAGFHPHAPATGLVALVERDRVGRIGAPVPGDVAAGNLERRLPRIIVVLGQQRMDLAIGCGDEGGHDLGPGEAAGDIEQAAGKIGAADAFDHARHGRQDTARGYGLLDGHKLHSNLPPAPLSARRAAGGGGRFRLTALTVSNFACKLSGETRPAFQGRRPTRMMDLFRR